jgi:hypothetical protein
MPSRHAPETWPLSTGHVLPACGSPVSNIFGVLIYLSFDLPPKDFNELSQGDKVRVIGTPIENALRWGGRAMQFSRLVSPVSIKEPATRRGQSTNGLTMRPWRGERPFAPTVLAGV